MRLFTFEHSPNPAKVRLALEELRLPCDRVEVNLFRREHLKPEFEAITPLQAVPVLEDGDLRLRESNAILLHLAAKAGWTAPPLALQWLFFESASLARACGVLWWTETIARPKQWPGWDEPALEEAAEDLTDLLPVLDAHLADRAFMLDDFSVVDCSIAVTLFMLKGTRLDLARWPNVARYVAAVRARPSWEAARVDAIHVH